MVGKIQFTDDDDLIDCTLMGVRHAYVRAHFGCLACMYICIAGILHPQGRGYACVAAHTGDTGCEFTKTNTNTPTLTYSKTPTRMHQPPNLHDTHTVQHNTHHQYVRKRMQQHKKQTPVGVVAFATAMAYASC